MNKDLQIELLKKDISFKDKTIDKLEEDLEAEKSINSYLSRRILKAIKYIEENKSVFGTNLDMNYLSDILKGEENE